MQLQPNQCVAFDNSPWNFSEVQIKSLFKIGQIQIQFQTNPNAAFHRSLAAYGKSRYIFWEGHTQRKIL